MPNFWRYRIRRTGPDAEPVFVAEYVVATTAESVERDLSEGHSRLKTYLEYLGPATVEHVRKSLIQAEALLGGLMALDHCSMQFGLWLPTAAPHATKLPAQDGLGHPTQIERGVRLWLRRKGDTSRSPAEYT